jgi:hypothetical protein
MMPPRIPSETSDTLYFHNEKSRARRALLEVDAALLATGIDTGSRLRCIREWVMIGLRAPVAVKFKPKEFLE